MPSDPVRIAEVRSWFKKAADDFRAAEHDLAAEAPLLEDALFHAQQAAEKTLKGFLTWHNCPFRKTHDLIEIGRQCVEIDASLEPLLRRAALLTEYAWKFRYPGEADEPSADETTHALEVAREVWQAILARLPDEIGPRA